MIQLFVVIKSALRDTWKLCRLEESAVQLVLAMCTCTHASADANASQQYANLYIFVWWVGGGGVCAAHLELMEVRVEKLFLHAALDLSHSSKEYMDEFLLYKARDAAQNIKNSDMHRFACLKLCPSDHLCGLWRRRRRVGWVRRSNQRRADTPKAAVLPQ